MDVQRATIQNVHCHWTSHSLSRACPLSHSSSLNESHNDILMKDRNGNRQIPETNVSPLLFLLITLKKKKTLFPSRRPQDAAIPFLKRKGSHELTYFLFTMSPNFLLGQLLSAYMFPGHSVHASIKSLAI